MTEAVTGTVRRAMYNKGLNEAFGEVFNFILLNLGYFDIYHPTPLRSYAFVAMKFIMLEMGSVDQGELACTKKGPWALIFILSDFHFSVWCNFKNLRMKKM